MRYRYLKRPHYIPEGDLKGGAAQFFTLSPSTRALAGYEDGACAGFFRYELSHWGQRLWAGGTWVEPEYRGAGLAQALWARVLRKHAPKTVVVRTISQEGRGFVASLVKWYPSINWRVDV